jgi:hypothetical protein
VPYSRSMLERGEAIGLVVILAVILLGTLYVAVRGTPSFALVFAPVELTIGGWVVSSCRWDEPDDGTGPRFKGGKPRWPGGKGGGGGSRVREPRRPRPSSGAGSRTVDP